MYHTERLNKFIMDEKIIIHEIPVEEELFDDDRKNQINSGCFTKTVAFLILLAFIAFSLPNFSYLFSNKLSFLDQNESLTEDAIVQKCKPAVVNIEVTDTNGVLNTVVRNGTGFNISQTGMDGQTMFHRLAGTPNCIYLKSMHRGCGDGPTGF